MCVCGVLWCICGVLWCVECAVQWCAVLWCVVVYWLYVVCCYVLWVVYICDVMWWPGSHSAHLTYTPTKKCLSLFFLCTAATSLNKIQYPCV